MNAPLAVRLGKAAAMLLAVTTLAAACSSSGGTKAPAGGNSSTAGGNSSTSAGGDAETIKVSAGHLVDEDGRTLYLWVADTSTTSNCSGACATAWPPVTTVGAPVAEDGATASALGTSKRGDGSVQVTYNGHPLYYFVGDKSAGQTAGQGIDEFGAKWWEVDASGSAIKTGASSSSSSSSGGGYAY